MYISSHVNLYLNVCPRLGGKLLTWKQWFGNHFPFWLSRSPLSDCSVKFVPMMSSIDWLLLIILWLFTNHAVRELKAEFIMNGPNKWHRNAEDKKTLLCLSKTQNLSLKHFPAACNSTESCGMQCTLLQTDWQAVDKYTLIPHYCFTDQGILETWGIRFVCNET